MSQTQPRPGPPSAPRGQSRPRKLLGAVLTLLLIALVAVVVSQLSDRAKLGALTQVFPNTYSPTGCQLCSVEPPASATGKPTTTKSRTTQPRTTQPRTTPSPQGSERDPETGLRWVELSSLPPEATETVELIERGGPFPYSKDGVTFGNRERILPRQQSGYYREYTVRTPGEGDRGARRVVTGDNDRQFFYTDDHYDTFSRIRR